MINSRDRHHHDYLVRARNATNPYSEGSEAGTANALIAIAQQQRTNAAELARLGDNQERLADVQAQTAAALERIATTLERQQNGTETQSRNRDIWPDLVVLASVVTSSALLLALILTNP